MAKKLSDYTFPAVGRPVKYEWTTWSDGDVWELEKGVDFDSNVKTMRTNACLYAKKNGMKVRTAIVDGGNGIVLQFYPDVTAKPEKRAAKR